MDTQAAISSAIELLEDLEDGDEYEFSDEDLERFQKVKSNLQAATLSLKSIAAPDQASADQ